MLSIDLYRDLVSAYTKYVFCQQDFLAKINSFW